MLCPECGGKVQFKTYVVHNVESYGVPVYGKTYCCGAILHVRRIITLAVQPSVLDKDGWGDKRGL